MLMCRRAYCRCEANDPDRYPMQKSFTQLPYFAVLIVGRRRGRPFSLITHMLVYGPILVLFFVYWWNLKFNRCVINCHIDPLKGLK